MSEQNAADTLALLTALTGFSQKAGHDLAGPLNQASSLLALFIKRYRHQIDADADQLLEYLQSAADRMEAASRGVRNFMEAAERPAGSATVDLNEALAAALERLGAEVLESGAVIVSEPLPVVCGDAALITAIFENLLGNSIKFREENETPSVKISARPAGEMHEIAIQDQGIGMEAEDAEVLFVAFKRLNGGEYPGPGLGLAMARMIVERHGGRIQIEPAADGARGTCVRFTLRPPRP